MAGGLQGKRTGDNTKYIQYKVLPNVNYRAGTITDETSMRALDDELFGTDEFDRSSPRNLAESLPLELEQGFDADDGHDDLGEDLELALEQKSADENSSHEGRAEELETGHEGGGIADQERGTGLSKTINYCSTSGCDQFVLPEQRVNSKPWDSIASFIRARNADRAASWHHKDKKSHYGYSKDNRKTVLPSSALHGALTGAEGGRRRGSVSNQAGLGLEGGINSPNRVEKVKHTRRGQKELIAGGHKAFICAECPGIFPRSYTRLHGLKRHRRRDHGIEDAYSVTSK